MVSNSKDIVRDALFSEIKCAIIKLLAAITGDGEFALDLLMISAYVERVGDHAADIAEWAIDSVTGVHKEARL